MGKATELQVQVDDVYACNGSCGGCVLSVAERKASAPDMPDAVLELTASRLREYVATLGAIDRVNVTFGVADHLLMPDDYIARIHRVAAEVVRAAAPRDTAHSSVFFTTSLIGRRERVVERLRAIRAAAEGDVALLPVVVLDPGLLYAAKFGPIYEGMILEAKALFGKVDLSINLSDLAVSQMAPGQLLAFASENGFDEVTVNWTPNLVNHDKTTGDIAATARWLLEFDRLLPAHPGITSSFRPVLLKTIHSVMCAGDGGLPTLRETVEAIVPETVRKSLQVDHLGNLLAKFEAVGDVPHAERFALRPLGHLADAPIAELLERGIPAVQRAVLSAHLTTPQCAACPYAGVCAGTGFHVFNKVMRAAGVAPGGDGCPHVARALLAHFVEEARRGDPAAAAA